MTDKEIAEIKKFISIHNRSWRPYDQISESQVFSGTDSKQTENVFKLIFKHQCEWNEHFNFLNFTKPLIQKLSRKLFDYGKMTADDCLFYQKIRLTSMI